MSTNSDNENEIHGPSEEEIIRDVEARCYKSFQEFDKKGSGGRIHSEQV